MKPEQIARAKALFGRLIELPQGERAAALSSQNVEDPELRTLVQRLLACDARGDEDFLATPLIAQWRPEQTEGVPVRVGPYRLQRLIGEGGMGSVYEAWQEHPRRLVALKIIRPERLTHGMLARFRYEAEVLGRLQHPGIAQIYEASTAEMEFDSGLKVQTPFFAMERVRGLELRRYAQDNALNVPQKLELLARICDAVGYAHQKGVIHRDLKPGNILVVEEGIEAEGKTARQAQRHEGTQAHGPAGTEEADGHKGTRSRKDRPSSSLRAAVPSSLRAFPKILDFGIARALGPEFETLTLDTATGQIVGTLSYMSPEQLEGGAHHVDIRADVYALGVILFELLTQRLPHPVEGRTIPQVIRDVCEEDAPRLARFNPEYSGDLEIISTTALAKDRQRRYASAIEFAADIRRYLSHQPILARAHTGWYVLSRAIRRHRTAAGLTLGLALTVVASAIGLAVLYHGQTRERQRAQNAATRSQKIVSILQEMLGSADPDQARGADYTVVRMLDDFAADPPAEWSGEPQIEAAVRETMGNAYFGLAKFEQAREQLERALEMYALALGTEHESVARVCQQLADVRHAQNDFAEADRLALRALHMRQRLYGEESLEAAQSLDQLGSFALVAGSKDRSEGLFQQALTIRQRLLGGDHPDVAQSLANLARLYQHKGDYERAEPLYRRALDIRRAVRGDSHPHVADTLVDLATLRQVRGDVVEAEELFRRSLDIRLHMLGPDHPDVAWGRTALASLLRTTQRLEEADAEFREAFRIWQLRGRLTDPGMATTLNNWGNCLLELGRFEQAERQFRQAAQIQRDVHGRVTPNMFLYMSNLAGALREQCRFEEADATLRDAKRLIDELPTVEPRHRTVLLMARARLERDRGDLATSLDVYSTALQQCSEVQGPRHPQTLRVTAEFADTLAEAGMAEAALDVALPALHAAQESVPADHPVQALIRMAVARAWLDRVPPGDAQATAQLCEEALALLERTYSGPHWSTGEACVLLGRSLCRRGKVDEGEGVIAAGLDMLQDVLGAEHVRTRRAAAAAAESTMTPASSGS